MNNQIFDLKEKFDFECLNLGNPSLLNNNNYFSKLSHGSINKNVYIQLPKCLTKQGIVKNSNKTFCELNYNICDKLVVDFFESLERFCIEKILENKELWFYNSSNLTENDIEELVTPIIKTYKQGKRFLIKTLIKNDKFNIYDENENIIDLNNYNIEHEFVPLLNVNGLKFSSKNFTIELILCQMMVIYPEDEFEKQLLIKVTKPSKKSNNEISNNEISNNEISNNEISNNEISNNEISNNEISNNEISNNEISNSTIKNVVEIVDVTNDDLDFDSNLNTNFQKNNNNLGENNNNLNKEETIESNKKETIESNKEETLEKEETIESNKEETLEKEEINKEESIESNKEETNKFNYLFNSNLEEVDTTNLNINNEDELFEIKSRDSIYLEIYKKAKQKAKEIRKNAVQAFLEAKNIKSKYNLQTLLESDSSDDEFFDLDN